MREILYKAKRISNGEWAEGFYVKTSEASYIVKPYKKSSILGEGTIIEVDENTVCQHTGMTDKNGQKIWENDIMVAHLDEKFPEDETYEQAIWHESGFCGKEKGSDECRYLDDFDCDFYEVCGNIFDNAELLERKE